MVLETLYACSWVHHYAIEIEELAKDINGLSDQDARWTLPDQQEESPLHNRLASIQTDMERKPSLAPSLATTISLPSLDQSLFTSLDTASPATTSFGAEVLHAAENTAPTMTSIERTPSRSSSKKKSTLASVVSSEMFPLPSNRSLQQSQKLEVMLDISDTFLDSAVQPVAVQITRQSWDMFASMQPRDLLRYVMTPRDPKNPDLRPQRNADNPVTKAVAFSNYLSNW